MNTLSSHSFARTARHRAQTIAEAGVIVALVAILSIGALLVLGPTIAKTLDLGNDAIAGTIGGNGGNGPDGEDTDGLTAHVAITVLDSVTGDPVEDAVIAVCSSSPNVNYDGICPTVGGQPFYTPFTSSPGEVGDYFPGVTAIFAYNSATHLPTTGTVVTLAEGSNAPIVIEMDAGSVLAISGTLFDGDSNPLPDVEFGFTHSNQVCGDYFCPRAPMTDGDGHFVIANIPAGTYTFEVNVPGNDDGYFDYSEISVIYDGSTPVVQDLHPVFVPWD